MREGWRVVRLGELCRLHYGKALRDADRWAGDVPVVGSAGQFASHSVGNAMTDSGTIVVGRKGSAGSVTWFDRPAWVTDTAYWAEPTETLTLSFLFLILQHADLPSVCAQTGVPGLNRDRAYDISVLLPAPEEQRRIVDLVGALDDTIAAVGAAKVAAEHSLSHCADQLVAEADGLVSQLGDVLSVVRGGSPRPIDEFYTSDPEGLPWIRIGDVEADGKYIWRTEKKIRSAGLSKTRTVSSGDFLLSNSMSFGRPYITRVDGCIHDGWLRLSGFEECFTEDYLYYLLRSASIQARFQSLAAGSSVQNLNKDKVAGVPVTVPSLDYQRRASTSLDAILAVVDGLDREADRLERLRSNLLTALLSGEHEIPKSYDELMEAVG